MYFYIGSVLFLLNYKAIDWISVWLSADDLDGFLIGPSYTLLPSFMGNGFGRFCENFLTDRQKKKDKQK